MGNPTVLMQVYAIVKLTTFIHGFKVGWSSLSYLSASQSSGPHFRLASPSSSRRMFPQETNGSSPIRVKTWLLQENCTVDLRVVDLKAGEELNSRAGGYAGRAVHRR